MTKQRNLFRELMEGVVAMKHQRTVDPATLTPAQIQNIQISLRPVDLTRWFDDELDETYSFAGVGGPFSVMSASQVLQRVDPIVYQIQFTDWVDSLVEHETLVSIAGDWYDRADVAAVLQDED